ncbi:MAG TPA: adenylate/guanylate cyclase domain-containing protein [Acidobacteriaceae bacterium]|nr:adenylate/guanylate cyclase domain-containing protein [Acidobacteriaceae bacterium]
MAHWTSVREWGTNAWRAAAIAAVATALVFAASHSTPFVYLNSWTYDFTVDHAGLSAPSRDVVFVDFDEDTFHRIGKYPVPRDAVAAVVKAVGAQKPRVIGLDILLSEPRTAVEDAAMQDALTSAGTVILASQDAAGVLPAQRALPMFCQPEDPNAPSGFCKDGTPGAMGYATINLPFDPDGFVRQALLFSGGANPAVSFPVMMVQQYTGKAIQPVDAAHASCNGHNVFYADRNVKSILIGSWSRNPATSIPAWKFMTGEVAPNAVADKLVLIGQSNDAARDQAITPLFRAGDDQERMAGTQVHAAAIRSLLEGTAVRPTPRALIWGIVFAVCWLASLLLLALRTWLGVCCAVLLAILPGIAGLLLYAKMRFWLPFLPAQAGVALTLLLTIGLKFIMERLVANEAREQRRELMSLFSSYVDPAVANTIWERRDELSLAGEERIATVMFTDIRSFTALSFGRPPADVLRWLNRYLTAMDEVIREHGGFLNKFIGDGLMVIFGLPLSRGVRDDAGRAVHAALAMLQRVEALNRQHSGNPDMPQLRIGIGIHTGPLMAGSIGSATRQEYSVIGETVNLASRLESLNKPFHTEILLSQATHDLLQEDFEGFRPLGEAKVPGLEGPVAIFTIAPAEEV